ncbi:Serine/threonine-protein phosphatase BSU1 [Diplonema papillatum]|nr:Serine/threonine-protein phosphatase BSU1 [Diplonema papillatum]
MLEVEDLPPLTRKRGEGEPSRSPKRPKFHPPTAVHCVRGSSNKKDGALRIMTMKDLLHRCSQARRQPRAADPPNTLWGAGADSSADSPEETHPAGGDAAAGSQVLPEDSPGSSVGQRPPAASSSKLPGFAPPGGTPAADADAAVWSIRGECAQPEGGSGAVLEQVPFSPVPDGKDAAPPAGASSTTQRASSMMRDERADAALRCLRSTWDGGACTFSAPPPLDLVISVMQAAAEVFSGEPIVRDVRSDTWVIGDIHGNFRDLFFFVKQLVPFDVTLCPYRLVCLGDYVDRGPHSLQCVLLLFALKLLSPATVVLLRGNHEDPAVCGDVELYGDGSFKKQCIDLYGDADGAAVFQVACAAFAQLPLAAVIDKKVFCVHGGIPRVYEASDRDTRMDVLRGPRFPRFPSLFDESITRAFAAAATTEDRELLEQQWIQAYDVLWSDPVRDGQAELDPYGFGVSERGGQAIAFSARAVESFLGSHGLDLMIRAHQEKRSGLRVSQSNKVITVFSSSNYQGHGNGAGVVLVRKSGKVDLVMKTTFSS